MMKRIVFDEFRTPWKILIYLSTAVFGLLGFLITWLIFSLASRKIKDMKYQSEEQLNQSLLPRIDMGLLRTYFKILYIVFFVLISLFTKKVFLTIAIAFPLISLLKRFYPVVFYAGYKKGTPP